MDLATLWARKQLAAIDWNFHLNQEPATTKTGEQIVTRKYNQRTKEWDAKISMKRKTLFLGNNGCIAWSIKY